MPSDSRLREIVQLASGRAAAVTRRKFQRGLGSLATIASVAPLIGLFGTLLGILSSFRGFDGEKTMIMAAEFQGLSEALAPCALGLFVAIPALWFYNHLSSEIARFDLEMKAEIAHLANRLVP